MTKRYPIDSPRIFSIGHENNILSVKFQCGKFYEYLEVPEGEYLALTGSPYPDDYFAANIENNYVCRLK